MEKQEEGHVFLATTIHPDNICIVREKTVEPDNRYVWKRMIIPEALFLEYKQKEEAYYEIEKKLSALFRAQREGKAYWED